MIIIRTLPRHTRYNDSLISLHNVSHKIYYFRERSKYLLPVDPCICCIWNNQHAIVVLVTFQRICRGHAVRLDCYIERMSVIWKKKKKFCCD